MHTKICTICLKEKPIESFYKQTRGRYGVMARCKSCMRQYYQSEKYKKIKKQYETKKEAKQLKKDRNKKRRKSRNANKAVQRRVASGAMPAASTVNCEHCDSLADHYHHFNGYEKKHYFDVIPLCATCHAKEHSL